MLKNYWLAGVILVLFSAMALAQESPNRADKSPTGDVFTVFAPVEYWLGIGCAPVPLPLRTQLNLPEKQGILVEAVVPDSPAAKAGIARHDVLLRAGDKPLTEPRDLVAVVEAAKEGKVKIDLIHGGKPKTVEATPAKRPDEARRPVVETPGAADWETMEKWMEGMRQGNGADGQRPPVRFRFLHPGAIVPRDVLVPTPLPPNMSIAISKEGDQPVKIVVKRGDEKWEVTEKELDKLPPDVRPHVERMLGRGPLGIVGDLRPFDFTPDAEPGPETKSSRGPVAWDQIEKRFDEMNRRMDKLLKEVEELGAGHDQKPTEK